MYIYSSSNSTSQWIRKLKIIKKQYKDVLSLAQRGMQETRKRKKNCRIVMLYWFMHVYGILRGFVHALYVALLIYGVFLSLVLTFLLQTILEDHVVGLASSY
jgi:hypothetical protein